MFNIITLLILFITPVLFILLRHLFFVVGEVNIPSIESRTTYDLSISEAIQEIMKLFDKSNIEILVVSGHLDPKCWNNKNVVDKLRGAIHTRSVRCKIITGPKIDIDSLENLKPFIDSESIQSKRLSYEPKGHFIVVDSSHVRLEDQHNDGEDCLRARILWDVPVIGNRMRKHFFELWKNEGEAEVK